MAPKDEDAAVRQFREELVKEDLLHDDDSIGTEDHVLLRFLRARQFDLKRAKIMWKNCYDWRKDAEGVGIDELYRRIDPFDYPERDHVFKYWPLFFHKTDKRGRPLNIHHLGRINTTELYKGITPERFWQVLVVTSDSLTREVLPAASSAADKHIDGTVVIVDLKGFGMSQFWQMKNLARGTFQVSQDYFPETMSQLAIVNAPSSFTAIWAMVRPWLAKETVEKVSVLGADYASALLKFVDPENLPVSLGGTCTCSECEDEEDNGTEKKPPSGGGVEDMGSCAYSSAGPWLVGRKERREAWLRGERQIALHPGELQNLAAAEKRENLQESEAAAELEPDNVPHAGTETTQGDLEKKEDTEEESASAGTGPSTENSSGPSTPPSEQLAEVKINDEMDSGPEGDKPSMSREQSVEIVEKSDPSSRVVQAGDLHAV